MPNNGLSCDRRGVTLKRTKAFELYLNAAKQGDALAMNIVGLCYANGQGVTQNKNEAFEWFLKSAENGYAISMNSVGDCYSKGEGVTQDKKKHLNGI